MQRSIVLRAFACALGISACAAPPAAELSEADRQTLTAMFDSTVSRLRAGQFELWASQFAEDGSFQVPNAATVTGRSALEAWIRSFPPLEEISMSNVQVSGQGDLAYGTSGYVLKPQGAPADTGKQLVVFRRIRGEWKVVTASFNTSLPLPAPDTTAARKP